MVTVNWSALLVAALSGSAAILVSMYFLLPALGLPRLDFASITGGWVRAAGPYARLIGVGVFVLGGVGWAFLYARFWPWHGPVGGMAYALIPFAIASVAVLPELHKFRIMLHPLPGFIWMKQGGVNAMAANLVHHLVFGLCLGFFYR